jgi:nitrogen fixation protein NifB
LLLCLATNGLELLEHIPALAELNLSHLTITINAVDPSIAARVYAWGSYGKRVIRGEALGKLIVERQLAALRSLKQRGMLVKVNCIILPGVNDHHIPEVARTVSEFGAEIMNCVPLLPVPETPFHALGQPDAKTVARVRLMSGRFVRQMTHCARCRADAAGLVGEANSEDSAELLQEAVCSSTPSRPYVAVGTMEGALVNQHLGEAGWFLIFEQQRGKSDEFRCIGTRAAPERGTGDDRWLQLASSLQDCRALLVSAAGSNPRRILEATGIKVIQMEGLIEEGLTAIFTGRPIPPIMARQFGSCGMGVSCTGDGMGCG